MDVLFLGGSHSSMLDFLRVHRRLQKVKNRHFHPVTGHRKSCLKQLKQFEPWDLKVFF